jgi:hypothetical protein
MGDESPDPEKARVLEDAGDRYRAPRMLHAPK